MIHITKYLPTGCVPIDEMLEGGIESGVVTQVFGEAGSGKTNLCLQLAVNCIKRGFLRADEKYEELCQKVDSMGEIEALAYLYNIMTEMNIGKNYEYDADSTESHNIKNNQNNENQNDDIDKNEKSDSIDITEKNISAEKLNILGKIKNVIYNEFVPKVVFIDTEGISAERFKQIAGENFTAIAKNIIIYEPHDLDEQYSSILEIEKIVNLNIGLVIVDSATSFYRYELDDEVTSIQSRRELANQIGFLHTLSRKYGFPVLITSQVFSDVGGTNTLKPLGGKAIEHISKTIMSFEKTGIGERSATLIKHRSIPEGRVCRFKIVATGLE